MNTETQQLIQDAAEAFADKIDDGLRTPRQCAIKAFIEAATRFKTISSAWHRTDKEEPTYGRCVILITGRRFRFVQSTFRGSEDWQKLVNEIKADRWAYKEDLL